MNTLVQEAVELVATGQEQVFGTFGKITQSIGGINALVGKGISTPAFIKPLVDSTKTLSTIPGFIKPIIDSVKALNSTPGFIKPIVAPQSTAGATPGFIKPVVNAPAANSTPGFIKPVIDPPKTPMGLSFSQLTPQLERYQKALASGAGGGLAFAGAVNRAETQAANLQKRLNWDREVASQGRFVAGLGSVHTGLGKVQDSLAGVARAGAWMFGLGTATMAGFAAVANPVMFERLQFAFRDLSAVIGQAFAPILEKVTNLIYNVADAILNMNPATKASIVSWIEWGTVIGGFILFVPTLVSAFSAIVTAIRGVAVATVFMQGALGNIPGLVIGLTAAGMAASVITRGIGSAMRGIEGLTARGAQSSFGMGGGGNGSFGDVMSPWRNAMLAGLRSPMGQIADNTRETAETLRRMEEEQRNRPERAARRDELRSLADSNYQEWVRRQNTAWGGNWGL